MKISVTGSQGRLGSRLVALGASSLDFDVTDPEAVRRELSNSKTDLIIHSAALSSISECEKDLEKAILVNVRGTNHVCEIAWGLGIKVLVLSTEQVFDGKKGKYREDDAPFPINDYGRTKFAAEAVAGLYDSKVIRLSRGISNEIGKDIHKYLFKLRGKEVVQVPDFIFRSYSHLDYLAEGVWWCANNYDKLPKILHVGGLYPLSFYELMIMIAEESKLDSKLVAPRKVEIEDFPRPYNCGFNISLAKNLGVPIYSVEQSVKRLREEYA